MPFTQPQKIYHGKNPIAVGSQVSVEKDMYVSTGVVTYVEGDILEIKLSHARLYEKGEPVKLTIYSAKGFQILSSSVIALDDGVLTVFNPPENQRLINRRQHPRVDVEDTGRICALRNSLDGEDVLDETRSFLLRNLSIGGAGFVLHDARGLQISMIADIELDIINGIIPCTVEITRMQGLDDGRFYVGAKIVRMEQAHMSTLRGYILRIQIKNRAKERKYEEEEEE